jgi:hypothetical protein
MNQDRQRALYLVAQATAIVSSLSVHERAIASMQKQTVMLLLAFYIWVYTYGSEFQNATYHAIFFFPLCLCMLNSFRMRYEEKLRDNKLHYLGTCEVMRLSLATEPPAYEGELICGYGTFEEWTFRNKTWTSRKDLNDGFFGVIGLSGIVLVIEYVSFFFWQL